MSLPPGAMKPFTNRPSTPDRTPPATPSQPFITRKVPQPLKVYEKEANKEEDEKLWEPWPLRWYIWLPFVLVLVGFAVGLEVAFRTGNERQGWEVNGDFSNTAGFMHYVYTLPPVIVAAMIVAYWAWTDIIIKKLQPYVALVQGDSPPERSLLLDYTAINVWFVTIYAFRNKHWLVVLSTIMALVGLAFQPLAAALLVVRDVWTIGATGSPMVAPTNTLALNQDVAFDSLTEFLAAAGYASASVQYSLPNPPWVQGPYAVRSFEFPTDVPINSTVLAMNTTAAKSQPNCRSITVNMQNHTDGSGWTNSAELADCNMTWIVDHRAPSLFGTDVIECRTFNFPPQFAPIVLWFFTYEPEVRSSATFCFPTVEFWDVEVQFRASNQSVAAVREMRQLTSVSNLTGDPLNGQAYNGIRFNLTQDVQNDAFVQARQNATQLTLPAAVWQAALQSVQTLGGNIIDAFDSGRFVGLGNKVYGNYLSLLARTLYFVPESGSTAANDLLAAQIRTVEKRLFLSGVATHLLAAGLCFLAVSAVIVHLLHRFERRRLRLHHEPGTIASAVAIGAGTSTGELLAEVRTRARASGVSNGNGNGNGGMDYVDEKARRRSLAMEELLKDKRFRFDAETGKIVMQGEEGYDWDRSQSEGLTKRVTRRLSAMAPPRSPTSPPRSPKSPRSPRSPTMQPPRSPTIPEEREEV